MSDPESTVSFKRSKKSSGFLSFLKKIFSFSKSSEEDYKKLLNLIISDNDYKKGNSDKYLIKNIISLKQKKVNDIMIPRVDIVAAYYDSNIEDILKIMQKSGFSRIPIYKEDLDDILGFIHAKDIIAFTRKKNTNSINKIIRNIVFVSPYMPILELLYEMRTKRTHLAIVVDEFGGVDGLITLEDIIESIIGEIADEYDKLPEVLIKPLDMYALEVDARVTLEDLEEYVGVNFILPEEKEEYNTLSGLIVDLAGYIPKKNEIIVHDSGVKFKVVSADAVKINKAIVYYDSIATEKPE